jgi:hypothetical protein
LQKLNSEKPRTNRCWPMVIFQKQGLAVCIRTPILFSPCVGRTRCPVFLFHSPRQLHRRIQERPSNISVAPIWPLTCGSPSLQSGNVGPSGHVSPDPVCSAGGLEFEKSI